MNWVVELIKSEKVKDIAMIIKTVLMLFLLYLYLMYADLSTSPEFIYNQF